MQRIAIMYERVVRQMNYGARLSNCLFIHICNMAIYNELKKKADYQVFKKASSDVITGI